MLRIIHNKLKRKLEHECIKRLLCISYTQEHKTNKYVRNMTKALVGPQETSWEPSHDESLLLTRGQTRHIVQDIYVEVPSFSPMY
ncbi:hypothetical protein DPMN_160025 [Dreissena polymorpha]|uniref:Uncharacterized protein n=1 Tax=Dreissena polymorpha TaxID=45954 RepID=A0A9D4EMG8_DREPO|nr:hypothetical protein DPMN_160025 [Dreissena polymorpha]